jgi:methylmalonyl-CoA mutase N-terminal domain/subunit
MDRDTSTDIARWFRSVGADGDGVLPDDGARVLSTGRAAPFLCPGVRPGAPGPDLPGSPPYRRGIFPTMYRGRTWTMRQYAGYGDAEDTNRRFRYLLDRGQTGLSLAFDLPTQMGLDPDAPGTLGEVGRAGVSVATVDDMAAVFRDIPLDRVSVSLTANATAAILVGMLQVVAEERGLAPEGLSGTVQNDILKEYVARGTYIYPPGPSLDLAADLIAWCTERMPRFNAISVSGYHMREAGADAVQEVAFTLANALAYARATMARGLAPDRFLPRMSFFFAAHNHFLEEVAKFRAARVAWARLAAERLGATDPRSLALRFHAQTAGSTLTAQQPENNVVRVALQALAAVLGGTQSLHTNAMDEALALPSEATARLALRTQQVIADESRVADFVDPLGGAWLVEELTDRIAGEALALIGRIDAEGGIVAAIEQGKVQQQIEDAAWRAQQAIEAGRQRVVGVNCHRDDGDESPALLPPGERGGHDRRRIDASLAARRIDEVLRARAERDGPRAAQALDRLHEAAAAGESVVARIVEAVRARATLGEISDALGRAWGTMRQAARGDGEDRA